MLFTALNGRQCKEMKSAKAEPAKDRNAYLVTSCHDQTGTMHLDGKGSGFKLCISCNQSCSGAKITFVLGSTQCTCIACWPPLQVRRMRSLMGWPTLKRSAYTPQGATGSPKPAQLLEKSGT